MRILVTGSRDFGYWNTVNKALLDACADNGNICIIHGDASKGADAWAQKFVEYQKVRVEKHPADWSTNRRSAGILRNVEMVKAGADVCLAFLMPCTKTACPYNDGKPHVSHGTAHCAKTAHKAAIPVSVHLGPGVTEEMVEAMFT